MFTGRFTLLLAVLLVLGTAGARTASAQSAQSIDSAIDAYGGVDEFKAAYAFSLKLSEVSNTIAALAGDRPHLGEAYGIMFDACETALKSGVSTMHQRPTEAWEGAYCSCDAIMTFDRWLAEPDARSRLDALNKTGDAESMSAVLADHRVFENDAYCREGVERNANAQP